MLLIKGLCKGVGFLQRSEVVKLTAMLKSAKFPQVGNSSTEPGNFIDYQRTPDSPT